jgi:beta-glucanase (GH16 family)
VRLQEQLEAQNGRLLTRLTALRRATQPGAHSGVAGGGGTTRRWIMLAVGLGVAVAVLGLLSVRDSGPTPPPLPGKWTLRLNDDFTTLDAKRWIGRYWWNGDTFWPTTELQVYRPANVKADGGLTLTARRDSGLTNFDRSRTNSSGEIFCCSSGMVSSGGIKGVAPVGYSFTYGYVEARIRVPPGAGTWSAFWMQRADYNDSAEMDAMEVLGRQPNAVQMHYRGPGGAYGGAYTAPSPLSSAWHTYALDWEPGRLVWYVDGIRRFTHVGNDVDSHAHYILINLAIGGSASWGGGPDAKTLFPATMRVAWVRVWQRRGSS